MEGKGMRNIIQYISSDMYRTSALGSMITPADLFPCDAFI